MLQAGTIDFGSLFVKVNAMTTDEEPLDVTFYARCFHKVGGIETGVVDFQFVDDYAAAKKRQQLYVNNQSFYVGYRVRMLDDAELVDAQIERKRQVDVSDADIHARFFGSYGRNLIYGPILYGGQIKQHGEYDEQQNRA